MSAQEDWDLLNERGCTSIKAVTYGKASLASGYQRATKKRLYIMRYDDKVTRFHLPARASSHAKREGLWMRRAGMVRACPEADIDLLAVVKEAVKDLKAS